MTADVVDILQRISDALDSEEILSRLDMSSEELVELIRPTILDNLPQFLDIYDEDVVEYEE